MIAAALLASLAMCAPSATPAPLVARSAVTDSALLAV
jgi:hypothetical protein